MSAPWLKFYPSDWRADPALRMCSIAARGLWMEMLCIMHEATPRGSLRINGRPVSDRQMATLAGVTDVAPLFGELEDAGVFSREEDGTIYSRRMMRDEEKAAQDKANGKQGGNPTLKPMVNPTDKAQIPEARNQRSEEKKDRAPAAPTPCQELESVLDHEHAQAVVDHRQRLKKPLTAYAAKQLASKLSKAPDANVAADAMIANGWQGFEAGWLENRTTTRPHSTASPPGQNFNAILDDLQGKTHASHPGPSIDASVNRADSGGASNLVQLNALSARR
jgi:hypothetical protein